MVDPKKESLQNGSELRKLDESKQKPKTSELRLLFFGILYGISLVVFLIIVFSLLYISDYEPEDIEEPEEPENQIMKENYPNFFENDTPHYPGYSESVSIDRCLLCHEDTGEQAIFKFNSFMLYNPNKNETALKCQECHVELKHKIHDPYNTCTDCHYQDKHTALSVSFNFFLEKYGEMNNIFCQECHTEQCSELEKVSHTHEDTCTNCHNDHKRIPGCLDCHDSTFVGPFHNLTSPDFEICTNCHKGGAHTRPIINDDMDCSICHTDYYANTLENFGGKHFTDSRLGKCSSCHTAHKEYPSCRDCHGAFPEHIDNGIIEDPNHDCKICHEGGAHDNRVTYSNYNPDLGDAICEVCHESEYKTYYEKTTEPERELYGNCLNCHKEHNTQIDIPHITPGNFLYCYKCHIGYDGPETMHIISNTSYKLFPYTSIPDEFCSNCHNPEYIAFTTNITSKSSNFYGGCTNCHTDHKSINYFHNIESPYENCIECHSTYNSNITTHNTNNISYEFFSDTIDNDFCSVCHETESKRLSEGLHASRNCVDCHGAHYEIQVDFETCITCHNNIPSSHDSEDSGCNDCHSLDVIHNYIAR
jgi:hypothetical protein